MRVSWEEYWLFIAKVVSTRATCLRLHCGCVLVKENKILGSGYNGSLPGHPHCTDVGCHMIDGHCKRTIHSEINAILNSVADVRGSTAYVTHLPCFDCLKTLIISGIQRIVYCSSYRITEELDHLTKTSGITVEQINCPTYDEIFG